MSSELTRPTPAPASRPLNDAKDLETDADTGRVTPEISVPRDLAVQLIGSDAGKMRRMRPHRSMTKGAELNELAAVEEFMKPFLDSEVNRVHGHGRPAANHVAKATVDQALALKQFCLRFSVSLEEHLARQGNDDRHHRSRQRFSQAWCVIRQINQALDLPTADGKATRRDDRAHSRRNPFLAGKARRASWCRSWTRS